MWSVIKQRVIKRKSKPSRGEPEEPHFNPFVMALALAGAALVCLLLYSALGPVFFGEREQEYQIVPYGSDITPSATWLPTLPTLTAIATVTPAPTLTPAPTSNAPLPISASTAPGLTVSAQMSGLSAGVSGLAFSPDGARIAAGSLDGTVRIWDVRTRAVLFTFTSASNRVSSVAFSADGSRLIAGGQDNLVRVWDATTGAELPSLAGPTAAVNGVAFSPAGLIAAAASDDGLVYVWDLASDSAQVWLTLRGHQSFVTSVAFSPDGTRLAAGGADRSVRVWTMATGAAGQALVGHTSKVTGVAFSPDGRRLASASHDHTVRLWDAVTGAGLAVLEGHTENVNGVAFSPDSALVASGSGGIDDDRVLLWRVADGALIHAIPSPGGVVYATAISPDGLRLAAGGATFLTLWTTTAAQLAAVTPAVQIQNDAALAGPSALPPSPVAPTPAATPVLPPVATAGVAAGCVLTVRVSEGVLHAAPDESVAPAGALALGQTVQPSGWTQGADGFTWWQVGGGWARGDLFVTLAFPTLPDQCWTLPPVTAGGAAGPAAAPATSPALAGTLAATLNPNATAATGCALTGLLDAINLRAGPGTDYEQVGTLSLGEQVQATGWTQGANGYTWWRLSTGAWVRADVVQWPPNCQTLPRVTP